MSASRAAACSSYLGFAAGAFPKAPPHHSTATVAGSLRNFSVTELPKLFFFLFKDAAVFFYEGEEEKKSRKNQTERKLN